MNIKINHNDEVQRFLEQIIEIYNDSINMMDMSVVSKINNFKFALLPKDDNLFAYLWHSCFFRLLKINKKYPKNFYLITTWDKFQHITLPKSTKTKQIFGKKYNIQKNISDIFWDLIVNMDDELLSEIWFLQFLYFARIIIGDFCVTPIYIPKSTKSSDIKIITNNIKKYSQQNDDCFFVFLENLSIDAQKTHKFEKYKFKEFEKNQFINENIENLWLTNPDIVFYDQIDKLLSDRRWFGLIENQKIFKIITELAWKKTLYEIYYANKEYEQKSPTWYISVVF